MCCGAAPGTCRGTELEAWALLYLSTGTSHLQTTARTERDFLVFPCWSWEHCSVVVAAKIPGGKKGRNRRLVLHLLSWALCPVRGDLGLSTVSITLGFGSGGMCKEPSKQGPGSSTAPSQMCQPQCQAFAAAGLPGLPALLCLPLVPLEQKVTSAASGVVLSCHSHFLKGVCLFTCAFVSHWRGRGMPNSLQKGGAFPEGTVGLG